MPPRKKARTSVATSPDPDPPAKTPPSSPGPAGEAGSLDDPWTDDEEIGLFKALMRWKPTGMHKHFRLLQLHQWMSSNGYIHPQNEHTKPAGIWKRLASMYDLAALDAREDARQLDSLKTGPGEDGDTRMEDAVRDADVYSEADNKIENEDFVLPEDEELQELVWKARFPAQQKGDVGGESDAELPELNMAEEPPVPFTPTFSTEPAGSEIATPGSRKGAAKKGRGGRASTAATVAGIERGTRRKSVRKTESVVSKDDANDEPAEEGNDDEDNEDGTEEDEESEGGKESQASSPGPRKGRSSKPTRGKGAARGRGRGRGRGK